jgi:hypothetical protein
MPFERKGFFYPICIPDVGNNQKGSLKYWFNGRTSNSNSMVEEKR